MKGFNKDNIEKFWGKTTKTGIPNWFLRWVERHKCPNCGCGALDLTIDCDNPIVCVKCHKQFGFVEKENEPFRVKR